MISLQEGKGAGAKKPVARVLCLRLVVVGTQPRVWRRILVRETMWLSRLHDTVQIVLDWFDYQTHTFALDDLKFGNPVKRDDLNVEDDRDVTLGDLSLASRDRMAYEYHIGEGWKVDVRVEKTIPPGKGAVYPLCIAGERAGPPEDCGGIEAFHDMLACLKEPTSDLGREWLGWLGPEYEPAACDLDKINKALRKLGK
jgi:Plasmid pRiA4b ORF-3-like protein